MQVVTLRIKVPQNQRKIFLDTAKMVVGPTKVQPGCISCRFYQDLNDPDAVILMEEWKTRRQLNHRLNSPEYRIVLSLIEMSKKTPEFKVSTISKTEGLEAIESQRIKG